jgi:hypothetical protein
MRMTTKLQLISGWQGKYLAVRYPRPRKYIQFIGEFAKLRKVTISFVVCVCVCVSVRNNSSVTGRIFLKFDTLLFFENLSGKFKLQ